MNFKNMEISSKKFCFSYLLNFEINNYYITIISNLPIIILKDNINLEIESKSIEFIPVENPVSTCDYILYGHVRGGINTRQKKNDIQS